MSSLAIQSVAGSIALTVPRCGAIGVRLGTADDIPFIDALQKKHQKMLGFMPMGTIKGKIVAGHVLVAEGGSRFLGYAAGRVQPDGDGYLDYLATIRQPTLVINGVHDEMIPVRNSYWLSEHIPDAVLLVYPDSGHGSLFQFHESFTRQVGAFLASDSPFAPY